METDVRIMAAEPFPARYPIVNRRDQTKEPETQEGGVRKEQPTGSLAPWLECRSPPARSTP